MNIDYIARNKERKFNNKTKYNKNNYGKSKSRKYCHIYRIYGHLTRDCQYNMKINNKNNNNNKNFKNGNNYHKNNNNKNTKNYSYYLNNL